jgi:hypothetical protein
LSRAEVAAYLSTQGKLSNDEKLKIERLDAICGEGPKSSYTADEVATYLEAEKQRSKISTRIELLKKENGYVGPQKFPWVRLRRSHQDVLTAEDPSLSEGKNSFDDLEGALFSYSRDFAKDTDTWSAKAALLAPFSFYTGYAPLKDEGFGIVRWGFVPSASLERISTTGDASAEVEQQVYRLGAFTKWQSGHKWLYALTARVFASYLYDDLKDQSIPAGEFELEPQSVFGDRFKIGYRTILWPKESPPTSGCAPGSEDIHDTAWIAYQLRTILHGEYGSVNSEGPRFTGTEHEFFRLGPQIQLDLKPLVAKTLSLSLKFQYRPALIGKNSHDTLGTADLEWELWKDEANLQKVSLKVSYVNGGLELSEERAHTLLIGLGAAF